MWEPGDTGFILGNEMRGQKFVKPALVEVLSYLEGDLHPYKVRDVKTGTIFYCSAKEIHTRPSKALKKPGMPVTEQTRKEAEKLAEKRLEELMQRKEKEAGQKTFDWPAEEKKVFPERKESFSVPTEKKVSFDELTMMILAIAAVDHIDDEDTKDARQVVISLAKEHVYEQIKDGCSWD